MQLLKRLPFLKNDSDIDSPTRDFIHSISYNIEFCDTPVLGGESANCSLSNLHCLIVCTLTA